MFRRICAAGLIVLAVSPFTAPFATCDLVALFHPHHAGGREPSLDTVVHDNADSDVLVVPTLMTRAGHVRVASVVDAAPAESLLTLLPLSTAQSPGERLRARQGVTSPRLSSVLRI